MNARKYVKRFEAIIRKKMKRRRGHTRGDMTALENQAWDEGVLRKRYDNAYALLAAQKLAR